MFNIENSNIFGKPRHFLRTQMLMASGKRTKRDNEKKASAIHTLN